MRAVRDVATAYRSRGGEASSPQESRVDAWRWSFLASCSQHSVRSIWHRAALLMPQAAHKCNDSSRCWQGALARAARPIEGGSCTAIAVSSRMVF